MLELIGLTKRYGARTALDGLTFAVQPGQLFGFVGQNGAGKTTAMRIVLGVLYADAGEVRWRNRALDASLRRRIGYMPEERGLYPKMKVREQLVYLARLHGTSRAAAPVAVSRWLEELGIAERAGDRVESLSLGNQQRVQLAAALVHDPEILVLDEPFSGLDPVGVDALAAVLRSRADAGVPVVFSSHQLELVERLCDAVGIIRDGRLVASGPVDELRRRGRSRRLRVVVDLTGRDAGTQWGDGTQRDAGTQWADGTQRDAGTQWADGTQRDAGTQWADGTQWPADTTWADGLPGVTVVDCTAADGVAAVTLELSGVDGDQLVLDAARAAGPVREFRPLEPTLTELFREVVTA